MIEQFDFWSLLSVNNLAFISLGFGLGKLKPKKLGAGFVSIIRKVTPAPIRVRVLSFLNRFAKGVDRAIKDGEVK